MGLCVVFHAQLLEHPSHPTNEANTEHKYKVGRGTGSDLANMASAVFLALSPALGPTTGDSDMTL